MRKNIYKCSRGFTLLEMIYVMALIGILASMVTPILFENINDARATDLEEDVRAVQHAVYSYYTDNDAVPTDMKILKGYLKEKYTSGSGSSALGGDSIKLRAKNNNYKIVTATYYGESYLKAFRVDKKGNLIDGYGTIVQRETDDKKVPLHDYGDVFYSVQGFKDGIYLTKNELKHLIKKLGDENVFVSCSPRGNSYRTMEIYIRILDGKLPKP